MPHDLQISDPEKLAAIVREDCFAEGYIRLNYGLISRKLFYQKKRGVTVEHCIDGSREYFRSWNSLLTQTNIGKAISKGAFFIEED